MPESIAAAQLLSLGWERRAPFVCPDFEQGNVRPVEFAVPARFSCETPRSWRPATDIALTSSRFPLGHIVPINHFD